MLNEGNGLDGKRTASLRAGLLVLPVSVFMLKMKQRNAEEWHVKLCNNV